MKKPRRFLQQPSSRHYRLPHANHCPLLEGGRFPRRQLIREREAHMQRPAQPISGLGIASALERLTIPVRRLWRPQER